MAQKEISCPSCKKTMPLGSGFKHDQELNFICSFCDAVLFGVTESAERQLKSLIPITTGWKKELLPIKVGGEEQVEPEPVPGPVQPPNHAADFEEYACFV